MSRASVSSARRRSRRATSDQAVASARLMRRSPRAAAFSLVAAARVNSPRSRPRRMTSTRSDMAMISGSSEEIRITPLPAPANSLVTACTAALAPTSMPLVGSSRISTAGLARQPLGDAPPSAGCRPTGSRTGCAGPCALMASAVDPLARELALAPALSQPRGASGARFGSAMLAAMENGRMLPWLWRSSGTSAMSAAPLMRAVIGALRRRTAPARARCGRRPPGRRCRESRRAAG